jgi:hypothetical protein
VIGRFFAFQYTTTNATQAVLYWFESSMFAANGTSEQKHMKISLITYPERLEELPSIENQTVALATKIASYWEPIVTWSQITLILSQQGLYIGATTSALLLIVTLLYTLEKEERQKQTEKPIKSCRQEISKSSTHHGNRKKSQNRHCTKLPPHTKARLENPTKRKTCYKNFPRQRKVA